MTIAAILQNKGRDVISITSDDSVATAIARLSEKRIGAMPVIDNGKVVGIFSERDVLHGLARDGGSVLDRRVAEVMIDTPVTTTPDSPVLSALSLMTRRRIRHLPVLDGDSLVGFVSIGDLVKYRIEKIEAEAAALRDYIQMG